MRELRGGKKEGEEWKLVLDWTQLIHLLLRKKGLSLVVYSLLRLLG